MKAFLQYIILLLTLIAISWGVIPTRYKTEYPRDVKPQFNNYVRKKYLKDIDEQKPVVVLLGDSMLAPAVNLNILSQTLDKKVMGIGLPGSASTLWYLIAKNNILEAQYPPQYLVIFFRDSMLTVPGYRVTGRYFEQIDEFAGPKDGELVKKAYLNQMNPLEKWAEAWFPPFGSRWNIRQGLDARIRYALPAQIGCDQPCMDTAMEVVFGDLNMDPHFLSDAIAAADDYLYSKTALDFDKQVDASFLPDLIQLAKAHNVQLILVRMRILRFAEPGSEPPALRTYNEKLAAYLADNGVVYLDYSGEQSLTRDAFSDPLHMNDTGKVIFTGLLGQDLLKYIP